MEDVSVYGLLHEDVTAFNLLRFTGSKTQTPQARCPRHNIVHEWRIIDFDRSFKIDMKNAGRDAKESPGMFNGEYIGYAGTFVCKYSSLDCITLSYTLFMYHDNLP